MIDLRKSHPTHKPVVLTIAGSDSGGGAGIQADLKTIEAHGAFGTSAITAVTAQNTQGVESSHVLPVAELEAQLDAVLSDFDVRAVKTGMLATAEIVETVTDYARGFDVPLVVDPVMVATSGDPLLDENAQDAYRELIAEATLVTPNADEAAVLTGVFPENGEAATAAGNGLVELGAEATLVKGGHVSGDEIEDTLVTADDVRTWAHPRIDTVATHGSGCALSAAIAARLAHGEALVEAVGASIAFIEAAVRYHLDVGEGPGSVHHLVDLRDEASREDTAEAVEWVVAELVAANARALVPEVGMNVVGATPYAEAVSDTAAVEGRITKTLSGIKPNRGVRFGASSHVARFLLAAREFHPELRFAVNCRFNDRIETAARRALPTVADYDRREEPEAVAAEEGSTMQWGARQAFDREPCPAAVIDWGAHGKEPIIKVVGETPVQVTERVLAVLEAL
jgi:hydroxymethylpyrimidine kinase/phosphomethylpyrimidine kinase